MGKKPPSTPLCWLKQNKDVKKVQHCNKKGWALSHIIGYEESDRKMQWLKRLGRRLLYMYCNGQQVYWVYLSASALIDLLYGDNMSASVAVYRNIYTEDRFKQAYGSDDDSSGSLRLRQKLAGRCRCSRRACLHLLRDRVPIFNWLPKYRLKKWILGDTIAGLTVGILHIPQGV